MSRLSALLMLFLLSLTGCSAVAATVETGAWLPAVAAWLGLWYIFWPVVVIGFIALAAYMEECDNNSPSVFFSFLFFIGFIQLSNKLDFIGLAKENTMLFIVYLVAYLAIGIVWSMIKLKLYAAKKAETYEARKKEFMDEGKTEEEWLKLLNKQEREYEREFLGFDQTKPRIIRWLSYWPFSLFWFLVNDPIKRLFEAIYKLFKGTYRRIYENSMKSAAADMQRAKDLKNGKVSEGPKGPGKKDEGDPEFETF